MSSKQNQVYNILLLGETGTGKSTLINAFANYSAYKSFQEAMEKEHEICLIPTKFSFLDEDYNGTIVPAGKEDDNECLEAAESGTMACKSYVFDLNDDVQLRFIDSSGFNATQGEKQDINSVNDLSDYAIQFKKLHAIAIVLRSNQADISNITEFCLERVLKNITDGKVTTNIIFILTHGTRPDQSYTMTKIIKNLGLSKEIKTSKENVFCFENEAFRHLMTAKKIHIQPSEDVIKQQSKNWELATTEFNRLFKEIKKMEPHDTAPILTSNKSMAFINNLSIAVGSILMNVDENLAKLTSFQKGQTNALIKRMSVINLDKVRTICTSSKRCKNEYSPKFSTTIKMIYYYDQVCCKGCKPAVGHLRLCDAISLTKCTICQCNQIKHELISYQFDFEEVQPADIDSYISQLQNESQHIQTFLAQLLIYAKQEENRRSNLKWAYKIYRMPLKAQIIAERLENITKPPITYHKSSAISDEDVRSIRGNLYNLPIYGEAIKNACEASDKFRKKNTKSRDIKVDTSNKVFEW